MRRRPCTDAVPAHERGASAPSLARMRPASRWRRMLQLVCASLLGAITVLPAACSAPPSPLPHSLYIWQRSWDPSLVAAVGESRTFAASLRVLVLQVDRAGDVATSPDVDWDALKATGLPVIAVVRIDGSLTDERLRARVPGLIDQELRRWRSEGHGGGTLEIDYDCATSKLADYARLLADIRATVLTTGTLSITALPAWRNAAELDAVLAQVDSSVLQVHAVRDPASGLFDPVPAAQWVADWSRRSANKPFLVALPAYGARLKLDLDGAYRRGRERTAPAAAQRRFARTQGRSARGGDADRAAECTRLPESRRLRLVPPAARGRRAGVVVAHAACSDRTAAAAVPSSHRIAGQPPTGRWISCCTATAISLCRCRRGCVSTATAAPPMARTATSPCAQTRCTWSARPRPSYVPAAAGASAGCAVVIRPRSVSQPIDAIAAARRSA